MNPYHDMFLCTLPWMYGEHEEVNAPMNECQKQRSCNTRFQVIEEMKQGLSSRDASTKYHLLEPTLKRWFHEDTCKTTLSPDVVKYACHLNTLFTASPLELKEYADHAQRIKQHRIKQKRLFFTEEERRDAVERVRNGESMLSVANSMNVTDVTIGFWCRKYGVVTKRMQEYARGQAPIPEEVKGDIGLFLEKYPRATQEQLADAFKGRVSFTRLIQYVREHHPRKRSLNYLQRINPIPKIQGFQKSYNFKQK